VKRVKRKLSGVLKRSKPVLKPILLALIVLNSILLAVVGLSKAWIEEYVEFELEYGTIYRFASDMEFDLIVHYGDRVEFYNITMFGYGFSKVVVSANTTTCTWSKLSIGEAEALAVFDVNGSGDRYMYFNTNPSIFAHPPEYVELEWYGKLNRYDSPTYEGIPLNHYWWNGSMLYVRMNMSGGLVTVKWSVTQAPITPEEPAGAEVPPPSPPEKPETLPEKAVKTVREMIEEFLREVLGKVSPDVLVLCLLALAVVLTLMRRYTVALVMLCIALLVVLVSYGYIDIWWVLDRVWWFFTYLQENYILLLFALLILIIAYVFLYVSTRVALALLVIFLILLALWIFGFI